MLFWRIKLLSVRIMGYVITLCGEIIYPVYC